MKFLGAIAVGFSTAVFIVGCATSPADVGTPQKITCVELSAPLSFSANYGLVPVKWTTNLEEGAYVSEKSDDKGTYYRAPPGGLSITGDNGRPFPGMPLTMNGGFYIPNSPSEPVWIYRYFSMAAAPVGERRFQALGVIDGRLYLLVFTPRAFEGKGASGTLLVF